MSPLPSRVRVTCYTSARGRRVRCSGEIRRQVEDSVALSLRARVALIQGGGRPAARAEVNRGIIVRLAPVNCGRYCWRRAGQQLQTGFELPADNNGAAVLLFSSLSPREQASATQSAAVKLHKTILTSTSHSRGARVFITL